MFGSAVFIFLSVLLGKENGSTFFCTLSHQITQFLSLSLPLTKNTLHTLEWRVFLRSCLFWTFLASVSGYASPSFPSQLYHRHMHCRGRVRWPLCTWTCSMHKSHGDTHADTHTHTHFVICQIFPWNLKKMTFVITTRNLKSQHRTFRH